MYEHKPLFLLLSLQKLPEDVTPQKMKTGSAKGCEKIKAWLETHIWHTKRMHMVDKWSYRLAEHCNDKGVRATYRYLRHGCPVSVSKPLNYQQLLVCRTCGIMWSVYM